MRPTITLALALLIPTATLRADDPDAATLHALRVKVARQFFEDVKVLQHPQMRQILLNNAAKGLIEVGERDAALDAWRLAGDALAEGPLVHGGALPGLGLSQAEQGEPELARETLGKARKALARFKYDADRLHETASLVMVLHRVGFDDEARDVLDDGLALARSSQDKHVARNPDALVAALRAASGDYAAVVGLLVEGVPPERLSPERYRESILTALADHLLNAKDADAGPIFEQALPMAYGVEDFRLRASLLGAFAQCAARLGRFDQAVQIAETIPDAVGREDVDDQIRRSKAQALQSIADSALRAGRRDLARAQVEQAARVVESAPERATSSQRRGLANRFAQVGDFEAALRTLDRDPPASRPDALLSLSSTCEELGRPDDARTAREAARDVAEAVLRDESILAPDPPYQAEPRDDATRRATAVHNARASLAQAQVLLGQPEAAEATLQTIPDGPDRDAARDQVEAARLLAADPDAAFAGIAAMDDPGRRAGALMRLAGRLRTRAAGAAPAD